MADLDPVRQFISKVVTSGKVDEAMLLGIVPDHFDQTSDEVEIWEFCTEHVRKYRGCPSLAVVKQRFPDYNFEVVTDTLEYVVDTFMADVRRKLAIDGLRNVARMVEQGVVDIDARFMEQARIIAKAVPNPQVGRFSQMRERINNYAARKAEGVDPGIRMGIREFDRHTMGIQPHEYITIMGWSGTGKSTIAQWIEFNAYLQGYTPMMISLEMEKEALFRKWDTMATNFEYARLKAMELSDADEELWKERAERAANASNDIIVLDDVGQCTVDRVYAEIMRHQPDLVCIDYVSLMKAPGRRDGDIWQSLTALTHELKGIARTTKVPIIGIAQTNRDSAQSGAQLDNVAFSVSIIQDSDIVLGLSRDTKQEENKQITVRMLKNRDGVTATANLLWDLDRMYIREWSAADAFGIKASNGGSQEQEEENGEGTG